MLSLSRAVGESLDLFVDHDQNPLLVALVERLGGSRADLAGLEDRITIQYTHHADQVNGHRLARPEAFLALSIPRHVDVWRSEKLARRKPA